MMKIISKLLVATLIVVLTSAIGVQAENLYWQPVTYSTSSWFTVENWNTSVNGTGDSYLPTPSDNVTLNGGVCFVDEGSNVVVTKVYSLSKGPSGASFMLDVEQGATLSISNYFQIGNEFADAIVNIRGEMNVVNALNTGFAVGGYNDTLTNSTAVLKIDGGVVIYGEGSDSNPLQIGGSSTGIVEITNGGVLVNNHSCVVGNGLGSQSDGTVIIQDGSWTNWASIIAGISGGTGRVIVNGGSIYSMVIGSALKIGNGGNGCFEMNGGELICRHGFNNVNPNANRSSIYLGEGGATGIGKFVQKGGYVEAVGLSLGKDGGDATAIISNGVFKSMSNNGAWPCLDIYEDDKFIIAGGEFICYTNKASVKIRDGGTLEFIGGKFTSRASNITSHTYSNSTIRVIGSKADIDIGWWRNNDKTQYTTMEMILTQDAGHLSTLKSPRTDQSTALPGTMDIGFAGGACLLVTNQLTSIYAGRDFSYTYVNPVNYSLALWDVAKADVPTGGDNMNLTLKASESLGNISFPSVTYASFAPTPYGYVDVDGLDSGTLPELTVMMTMTAGDKTLVEVVTDLQSAGYTNSVVISSDTISMKVPAEQITQNDGYLGFDFREFDGTVNATVSAVSFQFSPKGSVFMIQ